MPFLRRLALAPVVFLAVAAVTYGMPRVLRPDAYPGEPLVAGLAGDLERAILHLDFGCSGLLAGCPPIRDLWAEGPAMGPVAAGRRGRARDGRAWFRQLLLPWIVIVLGLIADGIVSRLDPRVRLSSGRAW